MADALTTQLKTSVDWNFQDTLDLSVISDPGSLSYTGDFADGTAANQADTIWHDSTSVTAASPNDHDMTSLVNTMFGSTVTITFVKVSCILIVNKSTTTLEYLKVGGDANALLCFGAANDVVFCGPDSPLVIANKVDGFAVTAGTGDILQVDANTGTVSYDIVIWGRTA